MLDFVGNSGRHKLISTADILGGNFSEQEIALADSTARTLVALSDHLSGERPSLVLGQGDTTTVLATALACYYQQIPFAHIEAGL